MGMEWVFKGEVLKKIVFTNQILVILTHIKVVRRINNNN